MICGVGWCALTASPPSVWSSLVMVMIFGASRSGWDSPKGPIGLGMILYRKDERRTETGENKNRSSVCLRALGKLKKAASKQLSVG